MRTSIPKSTVSRKLRLLNEIGMIDVNQGEISIPVDEKGNSVLLKFIPNGKILLDNMVNTTQRS
jgi:DNA-binding transcriptional ArsR family regulator